MASEHLEIHQLIMDIEKSNPAGNYLRFDDDFENLKMTREKMVSYLSNFENDEPSKSHCSDVKNAAYTLLHDKTKDLQVALWLVESLLLLEQFSGLEKATSFLVEFVNKFWLNMHPYETDGEYSAKLSALDWLDKTMLKEIDLLKFIGPSAGGGVRYNKFFLENLRKKEKKYTGIQAKRLSSSDRIVFEQFNKEKNDLEVAISQMKTDELQEINREIQQSIINFKKVRDIIEKHINSDTGLFKGIIGRLIEVDKVVLRFQADKNETKIDDVEPKQLNTTAQQGQYENIEQVSFKDNSTIIDIETVKKWADRLEDRSELYAIFKILIERLKKIDPNSPNVQLGNKMLMIKDMNFIDIMEEIVDDTEMIDFVSRFFGISETATNDE